MTQQDDQQTGARHGSGVAERIAGAARIFRRFFDLIERIEAPRRGIETKSAPRPKARITRLDDGIFRRK